MTFSKYLWICSRSFHRKTNEWLLDVIAWNDIERIRNLSDYDVIGINLDTLAEVQPPANLSAIWRVLSPHHLLQVINAGGTIFVIGNPKAPVKLRGEDREINSFAGDAVSKFLLMATDKRALEFRRVKLPVADFQNVAAYLSRVQNWGFSFSKITLGSEMEKLAKGGNFVSQFVPIGTTTFGTCLAAELKFRIGAGNLVGKILILPPLDHPTADADAFVLSKFLNVLVSEDAPPWIASMTVPAQVEISAVIAEQKAAIEAAQLKIDEQNRLLTEARKWLRLLYEDGDNLEQIVKSALEELGAKVEKPSREKDDFRLRIDGFSIGILEVKGTHNERFAIGVIRQLSGWMDEAFEETGTSLKGVFIGNAGRKEPVHKRGSLVEPNAEQFAKIRNISILRSVDLYCVVLLNKLGKIDSEEFWRRIFETSGAVDAQIWWDTLPAEYKH